MLSFIVKRIFGIIPILLIVSVLSFMLIRLTPSDPIRIIYGNDLDKATYEKYRALEGFDDHVVVQYGRYLWNIVSQGDFGKSYRTKSDVAGQLMERGWSTAVLTMVAMGWAILFGLLAGIISATKRNTIWDRIGMVSTITALSVPEFWFGMVLVQVFSVQLGWLPSGGAGTWKHLLLPSLTLGLGVAAVIARFTRASVLEVLREDYVRTARAKGQKERVVVWSHVLRNALIPVVTMTGLQFGFLIGGASVVESVFAYPGLGALLVDSISSRDYPVVQALILLFSFQFLIVNLLVDISYGLLNPQIRYD
ncbi:glutathione ABC transporter permease [Paenibacillus swuensis]|uniref:Glutathione transport system permease protein GsiC n=1 Tax=Paenibacillus swuensis TaxID=1178515 RepID=A0A172TDR5_9BACL|nr:ABC transporter permease subunit [Paenibacillus swuensis]ANE45168.1 glutathione ABC transporter permease [Paenibacillus swuensis]